MQPDPTTGTVSIVSNDPPVSREQFRTLIQGLRTGGRLVAATRTGNYRVSVTFNGFECHTQTWDSLLQSDGAGDEIYATAQVIRSKRDGGVIDAFTKRTSRTYGQAVSLPFGQPYPDRETVPPAAGRRDSVIGYGTAAGGLGGIRSGDMVPHPKEPWSRRDYESEKGPRTAERVFENRLPMVLYDNIGRLEDHVDEVLTVIPTLHEWDGGRQLAGTAETLAEVAAVVVPILTTTLGGPYWMGPLAQKAPEVVKKLITVGGRPGDREIGLVNDGGGLRFDPLALTVSLDPSDLAVAAAITDPRGYGRGVYSFYFKDSGDLGDGAYTAYIEVRFTTWPDLKNAQSVKDAGF